VGTLRAMISYAAPRIPAGVAFGGLLAIGPLLAPHLVSLVAAAYLATGQALLRVVEGATEAFGRVALPRFSQLAASGDTAQIRSRVADIIAAVVHIGLYATCHLWLWTPELLVTWLGPRHAAAVDTVRLIALATLPYLLFVTLRSVLDALEERALNATNVYVAIVVTVVAALALSRPLGAEGLAIATVAGLSVLGCLTILMLYRICRFPVAPLLLPQTTILNATLLGAAVTGRQLAPQFGMGPLNTLLVVEVATMGIYAVALRRLKPRWLQQVGERIQVQR
jgi:O-antigen/teichoic acid export membrane protein